MLKQPKINLLFVVSFILVLIAYWYSGQITRNPIYGKVFYRLGQNCQNECSPEKGIRYFQKALYHDPSLIDAYYQIGNQYARQGNYDKEIENYKKAVQIDHDNEGAYIKLGMHYFQKGEYDYAIRYLLQSNWRGLDQPDTYYYLAKAYEHSGIYERAVYWYTTLMVLEAPYGPEACQRIWNISKIPGQLNMILKRVDILLGMDFLGQDDLWEQVSLYVREDQVPDFVQK